MKRVLLLATTTGYQTRMFEEAAQRMGVELVYATDRCDQLDDPWRDGAIAVRFHEEWRSVDTLLKALEKTPVDGAIAVGDRPTVLGAQVAQLLGLRWHPPDAAAVARDKRRMRERLRAAGLAVPSFFAVPVTADPARLVSRVEWPAVIKPTVLSGSRGVIRVDDELSFLTAYARLSHLLDSPEVRELRDPEADVIQIERYIDGVEFAIEAVMDHGRFQVLAIFDKPDPLEGPFFEETTYVTPSRASGATLDAITRAVTAAATAIGLHHGSVHAECRVAADGVYVLEVAARPIGGLCAKALRFVNRAGDRCGLEELLLRQALGEPVDGWSREAGASAVMMIPIPRGGIYRRVAGIEEARAVADVDDVLVTAKPDQRLVPLPEGASYLGFIFARASTPEAAEAAVKSAHAKLRFTIDPLIELAAT
ncbi:MAG: ATP-grasp domain-containing protein [Vicinamibacterales bacterium]